MVSHEVSFDEIADGVHVLRHPVRDVTSTLIVGRDEALVVDTLASPEQATSLLTAVRRVTTGRLRVVNTHAHVDHCFGNATLVETAGVTDIWAHQWTAERLRADGGRLLREAQATYLAEEPPSVAALADVAMAPPTAVVHAAVTLDVGGRRVRLCHLGRGHTAGDLVVLVPDARVVIAGDLVTESLPPEFASGYPLEWPMTLAELLPHCGGPVVPGHGAVVDAGFVQARHAELTTLSWLIRDGHADGVPVERVARHAPFDRETARTAVKRGFAELDGRI